ncbi:hypothetical protein Kpol_1027p23 [Vanderwaltozyma polyspora DSM 70294]|uniref:Transcription factor CBF/NF-Y/archaeal histone domain-containing protein n=1 Tax=Vanderwaltozyma polyspora (strain ATCC 22028 / DSM 70294 / BCRC 21397 / CBS 2163 / NBRC 10782 / NRRL Y-8283 / UCD 57-17) TaxID=436907 RepID=A7TQM7_VANPO|nr:uncharacterized protein Kpol_1027p23 [Vanderwaltozyma polyspora DSM 70294]EDO15448.1 hypothetical protein Kpol_1027p23 [Vanderwaltozyma polyspora DSM 70294]
MTDSMEVDNNNTVEKSIEDLKVQEEIKLKSPHLPLSKVKKIAKCDPEHVITSNAAFVATSFATEIFIKNLTEETLVLSQLNQTNSTKQVKRLTYEDLAKCVARNEKFQFLADVLPMTKNLKNLVKENKVRYTNALPVDINQTTLPFTSANGSANSRNSDEEEEDDDDEEEEEEEEDDEVNDDDDEDDVDEVEDQQAIEKEQKLQEDLKEVEQLNHVDDIDKPEIDNNVEDINIDSDNSDE